MVFIWTRWLLYSAIPKLLWRAIGWVNSSPQPESQGAEFMQLRARHFNPISSYVSSNYTLKPTGLHYKVVPRLQECCRQVEAEGVSNSRNRILKTWARPYSEALLLWLWILEPVLYPCLAMLSTWAQSDTSHWKPKATFPSSCTIFTVSLLVASLMSTHTIIAPSRPILMISQRGSKKWYWWFTSLGIKLILTAFQMHFSISWPEGRDRDRYHFRRPWLGRPRRRRCVSFAGRRTARRSRRKWRRIWGTQFLYLRTG